MRKVFYLVLSLVIASCTSNKELQEKLAFIDVTKEYPEKKIELTDIADVSYLYLNSKNDDYLYKGSILQWNLFPTFIFLLDKVLITNDTSPWWIVGYSQRNNLRFIRKMRLREFQAKVSLYRVGLFCCFGLLLGFILLHITS